MMISLNKSELDSISKVAKDHKFEIKNNDILYESESVKIVANFIKCHRYLSNLRNSISDDNIKEKLSEYLVGFKELYKESEGLMVYYRGVGNSYFSRRVVDTFISDKKHLMDGLIDVVLPLGNVTPKYDPDTEQAYY